MAQYRHFNIDALNDLIALMTSLLTDMQTMQTMLTVAAARQEEMEQEQGRQGGELIKLNAELVKMNARLSAGINVKTVATLPIIAL